MHLDKLDLCEARAAFDAHRLHIDACRCGACWDAVLTAIENQHRWLSSEQSEVRDAVLAAREWHRKLAEKAKERDQ